jgi:hypothetical protein
MNHTKFAAGKTVIGHITATEPGEEEARLLRLVELRVAAAEVEYARGAMAQAMSEAANAKLRYEMKREELELAKRKLARLTNPPTEESA